MTEALDRAKAEALEICRREVRGFDERGAGLQTDIHAAVLAALTKPSKGAPGFLGHLVQTVGVAVFIPAGDPIPLARQGSVQPVYSGPQNVTAEPRPEALEDDTLRCGICNDPFVDDDLCSTDIELGTVHAACGEGSAVVDLETGEPKPDGKIATFRFGDA